MQINDWKAFVKSATYKEAFMVIFHMNIFRPVITSLVCPKLAKLVFNAKTGMLDIKANFKNKYANVLKCLLCMGSSETFSHIFICPSGLWFLKVLRGFTLEFLNKPTSVSTLKKLGKFLERYLEARKLPMQVGEVVLLVL